MNLFKRFVAQTSLAVFAMLGLGLVSAQAQESEEVLTYAEVEQQAMELKQSVLTYSEEQREALVGETEAALTNFDRRIDNLQANIAQRSDQMSEAAERYANNMLRNLEEQRSELAGWFSNLKQESDEAWDEVIYGFSSAYDEFYDSWENLEAQFGSNEA